MLQPHLATLHARSVVRHEAVPFSRATAASDRELRRLCRFPGQPSALRGISTGYSFGDGPIYDAYTSTPSSSINVVVQKAFNRWGVGDHTKANQMYGYYDGSCATNFWHWNYVCSGCWVEYALFYE